MLPSFRSIVIAVLASIVIMACVVGRVAALRVAHEQSAGSMLQNRPTLDGSDWTHRAQAKPVEVPVVISSLPDPQSPSTAGDDKVPEQTTQITEPVTIPAAPAEPAVAAAPAEPTPAAAPVPAEPISAAAAPIEPASSPAAEPMPAAAAAVEPSAKPAETPVVASAPEPQPAPAPAPPAQVSERSQGEDITGAVRAETATQVASVSQVEPDPVPQNEQNAEAFVHVDENAGLAIQATGRAVKGRRAPARVAKAAHRPAKAKAVIKKKASKPKVKPSSSAAAGQVLPFSGPNSPPFGNIAATQQ